MSSSKTKDMGKVLIFGMMVLNTKVTIVMAYVVATVFIIIQTEPFMKELGKII